MIISTMTALAALAAHPEFEKLGEPSFNGNRLPFAEAARIGNTLYLSGQIGNRPDGTLPESFEGQSRQVMDNIGAILAKNGLDFSHVAKCTVMIDDMAQWPAFNAIYVTYFKDGMYPARSAFGADGLALGAMIEVECIAYVPSE